MQCRLDAGAGQRVRLYKGIFPGADRRLPLFFGGFDPLHAFLAALVLDPAWVFHSPRTILKVFLDGDTTKLAFTRRFLVSDAKVNIQEQILQPLNYELARTHQRIQFTVNTSAINPSDPMGQIKVVVLQENQRWISPYRASGPVSSPTITWSTPMITIAYFRAAWNGDGSIFRVSVTKAIGSKTRSMARRPRTYS